MRPQPEVAEPPTEAGPDDAIASAVADLFRQVLGLPACGPDDSFFRLGVSSLDAVRVAARLRERYGVRVALADVFTHPTARALGRWIAAQPTGSGRQRRSIGAVASRRRRTGFPLSLSQQCFYDMDRAVGVQGMFTTVSRVEFTGDVDPDALVAAVRDVVVRQEALRTVVDDGATQHVVDEPARVRLIDLRAGGRKALERLCRRESLRGFDLDAETPARFTLARTGDDAWCLVPAIHHVAFDGVSRQILVDEVARGYAARLGAGEAPDPPGARYVEFAQWQRDMLSGPRLAEHLAGLAEILSAPAPCLAGGPSEQRTYVVRTDPLAVPADTTAGLAAAAAADDVSVASVVAAALLRVAARRTGVDRQLLAIQTANRGWPDSDRIIGCFSNLLPVSVRIDPTASAADLVRAVHQAVGETLRHEEMPFDHALTVLAARGRDLVADGHLPTLGYALQPAPTRRRELPGCVMSTGAVIQHGDAVDPTMFTLTLELWPEDGLRGVTRRLVDRWPGTSFEPVAAEFSRSLRLLAGRDRPGA